MRYRNPTLQQRKAANADMILKVIDHLKLASWILRLEKDLAVQKEVEGPVLGPALFKKYDDRIVHDVWLNALQRSNNYD